MKSGKQIFLFIALSLVASQAIAVEGIIEDPLNGSTKGKTFGSGQFTSGGWKSTGGGISYDLGAQRSEGYIEVDLSNYKAQDAGCEKSHPVSGYSCASPWSRMCRECFFQLRIGHYNPFKVLWRFEGASREEARVGNGDGTGRLRVEWTNNTLKFSLNGKAFKSIKTSHKFHIRYLLIGNDQSYKACARGPTFSNVKIAGDIVPTGIQPMHSFTLQQAEARAATANSNLHIYGLDGRRILKAPNMVGFKGVVLVRDSQSKTKKWSIFYLQK